MISLIDAGPGTGKTFTILYGFLALRRQLFGTVDFTPEQQDIVNYILEEFDRKDSVIFFAHANSVVDKLKKRLGRNGPPVYTFHGAGYACLRKRYGFQKRNTNRTEKLIKSLTGRNTSQMEWEERRDWLTIKRYCHHLKSEAMDPSDEAISYIWNKYPEMEVKHPPNDINESAHNLLSLASRADGEVDYGDMIRNGTDCIRESMRYDLGIVDESQDISGSSYKLVTTLCRNAIFCGDKNQAINAFAGASEEMYDRIAERSDAILPLKVTQRCPPAICDLANSVRPGGILEGPNQRDGEIQSISMDEVYDMLKWEGQLDPRTDRTPYNTYFVSRTNAVIINFAVTLHTKNIPFRLVGKEISSELVSFIKSFGTQNLAELRTRMNSYEQRAAGSSSPFWAQICSDKVQSILACLQLVQTYKGLIELVSEEFVQDKEGFPLTTLHKAKGLEAPNIFVLNPPIELPVAMDHAISREQEINLHFMGVTRSSKNLYWVK